MNQQKPDAATRLNQALLDVVVRQRDEAMNRLANCEAALRITQEQRDELAAEVDSLKAKLVNEPAVEN